MNLEAIALSRISCAVVQYWRFAPAVRWSSPASRAQIANRIQSKHFLFINFRIQLLDPSEQFSRPRNMNSSYENCSDRANTV